MQGVMGSGVAKSVKQIHPNTFEYYKEKLPNKNLGDIIHHSFKKDNEEYHIFHALTQKYYGDLHLEFDYESFYLLSEKLNDLAKQLNLDTLFFPKIGSDRGKGDWNIISQIIEDSSKNYQPVVCII